MDRGLPSRLSSVTPLWAVSALTFLASIGTGVVWNGVAFIAKHDYRFSEYETLALYVVLGLTYVIGALSTGRVLRRLESVASPRTVLGMILVVEAIVCASLWFVNAKWMLWLVACAISVLSSWVWPIVESYLTAGRHGRDMRRSIGWWNLSWTGAVAVALVMMMPVMREEPRVVQVLGSEIRLEPRMAIVMLGLMHAVAIIPLAWFPRFPGAHDASLSIASIQPEYPLLLRAARMLLPLSYVLNSAMSPLLPYLMTSLAVDQQWHTTIASTWMWVRIIAMAIMWQVGFWHGRWGTLLLGGAAMTLGFGLAVISTSLPLLLIGLSLFGTGMGIVYYAALYYAMAVGHAEVEAGGTHEALIGLGYTIGPMTGILGLAASSAGERASVTVPYSSAVVAIAWLLIGLGAIGVAQPYLKARRERAKPPNV